MDNALLFPLEADCQAAASVCYHCGLPLVKGAVHVASIKDTEHSFCCTGCLAVATLIYEGGLGRYYEHREKWANRESVEATPVEEWVLYDDPAVQASFVRDCGEHEKEAVLILEGIRCAACVWLNEHHLLQQSGVLSVQINYANHRARIQWDARKIKLSTILAAIAAIGYRAWPFDTQNTEQLALKEQRSALFRLGVALLGMMQVMMYAWPLYFTVDGVAPDHQQLLNWVSLILTLPVVFYSAAPMFRSAWRGLCNRQIGMDVPVVLGISAAFIASVVATVRGYGPLYFDSVTMFVGLLLAARYLELRVRQHARSSAEQLVHPLPPSCRRWAHYPEGEPETIARVHLAVGDVVQVKPGEVFPGDGDVINGESEAEEAMLTGESHPVLKRKGDKVLAGSYNFASPLVVRLTQIGEGTRLAEIARLLDRALAQKPPMAELADRVARWFVAALLVIAVVVALVWMWIEPSHALMVTVAVLVVSCPCALSLATPTALAAATSALARRSMLILGGHALETLAQVTDVVMDKTGTLTTGQFELVETQVIGGFSKEVCLAIAGALGQASEHPLARRLVVTASGMLNSIDRRNLKSTPGMGVEGEIEGQTWRMGRYEFAATLSNKKEESTPPIEAHLSTVWLSNQSGIQALFLFSDTLREGALTFVGSMKKQGKHVHMLSGDRSDTVRFWAKALGIEQMCAEASPMDKQAYVQALQQKAKVVAMIGDGVNDAPVLASAQVSLTLASGAPLAQAGADVVLMKSDLYPLVEAFDTARRTRQVIVQNLAWAFAYNIIAVPLAATGNLTPLAAGAGMSLSSLLVVLNALRLSASSRLATSFRAEK